MYSLGIVLFEMLCGTRPFTGSVEEIAAHHQRTRPPRPTSLRAGLPPAVERVVLRCLEKEPGRRYPGFSHLVEALQDLNEPRTSPKAFTSTMGQTEHSEDNRTWTQAFTRTVGRALSDGLDKPMWIIVGVILGLMAVLAVLSWSVPDAP